MGRETAGSVGNGGARIWARVGRGGQGCEQVVLSIVGSSCEYDMCCS